MVVFSSRQTAWAEITEALQKAQRVHIVQVWTMSDGKTEKDESWYEKPNHMREDHSSSIIVDDGINRAYLDRTKKTVQLSDSHLPYYPIEQHGEFQSVDILQKIKAGDPTVSVKLTALPDEKRGAVQAFAFEIALKERNANFKGKLWIASDTKLPIRGAFEGDLESEKKQARTLDCSWSYDPIPAAVFSTAVPAGYTELPRKQRGVLKGRLLSEQGAPVAGAVVYATTMNSMFNVDQAALESMSDAQGNFEVKLPLELENQPPISFPVFVAAYKADDPDHVAWTLVTNPNDKNETSCRVGPIPGDPGQCEVLTDSGSPRCGGASGIILNMEPAGRISGVVIGTDGAPIRNAAINVMPQCSITDKFGWANLNGFAIKPRGPGSTKTALATTDAQGRYELTNVPRFWDKVTFHITVQAEGYVRQVGLFTTSGPLVSQEMNFRLYKAAFTVSGRAVNDRGEPMVGYQVLPVVGGAEDEYYARTVEADGGFTLPDCPETPELRIRLKSDLPPGSRMWKPTKDFYPQVEAGIKYEAGKTKYEVNLVAETPAITLRVVLRDSSGMPVPYYPVQLMGGCMNIYWSNCRMLKWTDPNGVCVLSGVPRSEGLMLWLPASSTNVPQFAKPLTPEQQTLAAQSAKFLFGQLPVKLAPERNEQTIEMTLLTLEEMKAQKPAPK